MHDCFNAFLSGSVRLNVRNVDSVLGILKFSVIKARLYTLNGTYLKNDTFLLLNDLITRLTLFPFPCSPGMWANAI